MQTSKNKWKYLDYPGDKLVSATYTEYTDKDNFPNYIDTMPPEMYIDAPDIVGLTSDNFFGIRGRCIMSGVYDFFVPVFEWLEYYLRTEPKKIRVEFWLKYYNTAASYILLKILLGFEKYQIENKNAKVNVCWYFRNEDDDMKKNGIFYQSQLEAIKLSLIPYDDSSYYQDMTKIFNVKPD